MGKSQELITTTDIVRLVLKQKPESRNSDNVLYYQVLKALGAMNGIDIESMSLPNYLLHMKDYGLPSLESVGRCRRKVIEMHPELAGEERVQQQRRANQQIYKNYSRTVKPELTVEAVRKAYIEDGLDMLGLTRLFKTSMQEMRVFMNTHKIRRIDNATDSYFSKFNNK